MLLEDIPSRLTQRALSVLTLALSRCSSAPGESHAEMLGAASPLWSSGLHHRNREVRERSLALLCKLCTACPAELPPSVVDRLIELEVPKALADLLACATSHPDTVLSAVMTLRGLLRGTYATARFRESRLADHLQRLPASVRQGALGAATSELLLRLGELGAPSALGARMRAALLPDESDAATGLAADGCMVFPDGSALPLHCVVLAARAPEWLQMLTDAHGRSTADASDTAAAHCSHACEYCWVLSRDEALALPHSACAALYELVLAGWVQLKPGSLRPKQLLGAAERLQLRALILSPPTDKAG